MQKNRHSISLLLTLLLVGLNLVALNYLLSDFTAARLDLTQDRLFSVSPATQRILQSLDEELTIYGYFSNRTHPKLAPMIPEIKDLLDEYRSVSRDKVRIEIADPGENEETEQEAADRFGVRSTPFRLASKYETGIVNAYFAIVVRYGDQYERYGFQDLIDVEMLPDGDIDVRLRNPEYDLTRAIKKVVYGFQGANELFERIESPVKLMAVITPDELPEILAEIPDAVNTAAAELMERGGDKFVFELIDPTGDDALKQELAARWGMRPMSLGLFSDQTFYLYGILEIDGRLEQLVLTGESVTAASIRESIESSLKRNTPGFLKTVGVVAPTQPDIPPQVRAQLQMPPQPPPEFVEIKRFLGGEFTVKDVDLTQEPGVPSDIDILLLLKPRNLDEHALFRLDQYLMRGGRVVICTGSYETSFGQTGLNVMPLTTGLEDWLAHHGVSTAKSLVLDDRNQPLPMPETRQTAIGQIQTWTLAPYPYLVNVQDDGLVARNITASLDSVGIYWGSPIEVDERMTADLEVIPILQSSENSWTSDDTTAVNSATYVVPPDTERSVLAVALNGKFKSYFAEKGAPVKDPPPTADGEEAEISLPTPVVPLEESPETRLVVIGNSEFLSDFVARSLGLDGGFFVENLRFVENVIDWTTLDNDMISIRSRGHFARRLDTVSRGQQQTLEYTNYVIPVVLLGGFAFVTYWRRKHVTPVTAETRPPMAADPRSKEAGS